MNLARSDLLIERTRATKKELSLRGGQYNIHTPRRLMDKKPGDTIEGVYRRSPKGPLKKRAGDDLRDEPLRHRAEPKRRPIESVDVLERQPLLIDHHTEG